MITVATPASHFNNRPHTFSETHNQMLTSYLIACEVFFLKTDIDCSSKNLTNEVVYIDLGPDFISI